MKLFSSLTLYFAIVSGPCLAADDITALTGLAEKGDVQAQYKLGYDYHYGLGTKKDNIKAVEWWKKSAAQDYAPAETMLGAAYSEGWGIAADGSEALKWYQKAAAQNYGDAKFLLATVYEFAADGVSQDHDKAEALWMESLPLLRNAAVKGDADAQLDLGTLYNKGWGVAKDDVESFKWRLKAAQQGHPMGQIAVAFNYHNGWGTPKDEVKAVDWTKKAAEQGDFVAQLELAKAYSKGISMPKDYIQAYKWADLSLVQGSKNAGPVMLAAAKHLAPQQLQEATKLSHDWQAEHLAPVTQ